MEWMLIVRGKGRKPLGLEVINKTLFLPLAIETRLSEHKYPLGISLGFQLGLLACICVRFSFQYPALRLKTALLQPKNQR